MSARRRWVVLGVLALAVAGVIAVYDSAWISDDATITFRYAWNMRHGHGAVFNVGERVQGYTHPLWFVLVTTASMVTGDEVYAATALGLLFTAAAIGVLGTGLVRLARDPLRGLLSTALVVVVLATSDSWRSFQTSGLEGSLSTLLFVVFVLQLVPGAWSWPGRVLLWGSLLLLCRPDFLLVVAGPMGLALLRQLRRGRIFASLLAMTPLLGFVVTRVYYGELLPNTATAKLGIFTLGAGVTQGLAYLRDFLANEPMTALASLTLLVVGGARLRAPLPRAFALGLMAYLVYLVVIGGDFMRGRLLVPLVVSAAALGGVALARAPGRSGSGAQALTGAAALGLLAALALRTAAPQTRELSRGIVNERVFYLPGHSLRAYMASGQLTHGEDLAELEAYVRACGGLAFHSLQPGLVGYRLGPDVTVIDLLGLTDRTIARLPRSTLWTSPPWPGHPYKRVPTAYLASRGDVMLETDWEQRLRRLDCSLSGHPPATHGGAISSYAPLALP